MEATFKPQSAPEEILRLINQTRQDPKSAIPLLQQRLDSFEGEFYKTDGRKMKTREGPKAVQDAIDFLNNQQPLPPLDFSKEGLSKTAQDHCDDLCQSGNSGHKGSTGTTLMSRALKHGRWRGSISENIALLQSSPENVLLHWLIDDGVASRGHRGNLFNDKFGCAGAGAGMHSKYKTCAVLVLAGDFGVKSGEEYIHLKSEYQKSGHDQLGVNDKLYNYGDMQKTLMKDMAGELNREWIPGAVSLQTKKSILRDQENGDKTIVTYIYTMGDGSIKEVVEEIDGVLENAEDDEELVK